MRRFKQVKRKEVIFDINEWNEIESQAKTLSMKTSEYIRRMALDGKIVNADFQSFAPVVNALRIIGVNINQIAKKSNEINSIYADDFKKFQEDYANLCLILSKTYSYHKSKLYPLHVKSRLMESFIPLRGFNRFGDGRFTQNQLTLFIFKYIAYSSGKISINSAVSAFTVPNTPSANSNVKMSLLKFLIVSVSVLSLIEINSSD